MEESDKSTQVTSNECQIILSAIDGYQKNNSEAHEQLTTLVQTSIHGVQLHFNSNAEVFAHRLDDINNHLAKLNGSVADLYKKHAAMSSSVIEIEQVKHDLETHKNKHVKFNDWIKKKWPLILFGLIGIMILFEMIVSVLGIDRIIQLVK